MDVSNLLICPRCGGELDKNCKCLYCGSEYERRMGVYSIIYEEPGDDYRFSDWTFDENDFKKSMEDHRAFEDEYLKHITAQCRLAERKQDETLKGYIERIGGMTVDIATGRGMFLSRVMEWNPALTLIGTDIDARVLAVTQRVRNCGENIAFIGCDGRHIALKDGSADNVISFVGLANMPDHAQAITEIKRILKSGGTFIYKGIFMDRDSDGMRDLKQGFGAETAMDIELLREALSKAGFIIEKADIVASGVWGENPYDRYPFAGENCNYGVIVAKKP